MGCEGIDTLCFSCGKACTNGCSWSKEFKPVEGWQAHETRQGYLVLNCPEYIPDVEADKPDFDKDGVMRLLEAAARQMREDYVKGIGPYDATQNRKHLGHLSRPQIRARNRKLIEKWLLSDNGRNLFMMSDPEEVISQLRQLARRYESELIRELGDWA